METIDIEYYGGDRDVYRRVMYGDGRKEIHQHLLGGWRHTTITIDEVTSVGCRHLGTMHADSIDRQAVQPAED